MSVEQMVRDLLEQAIKENIVKFDRENYVSTNDVQELCAGDIVGTANLLQSFLADYGKQALATKAHE